MDQDAGGLTVRYHFEVPGLAEFRPQLYFPTESWHILNDPTGPMAKQILFSIGMVELVSYWKIACPPQVIVHAGHLNDEQIKWWKDLYFNGLGEFFYINQINPVRDSFMTLVSTADPSDSQQDFTKAELKVIPIGGGKDSIVTIEHLRDTREQNLLFGINSTQAALDTMEVAGYPDSQRLLVKRTLDPEMLRLNCEGYLNGHTPFSALLAFVSYYSAYVTGSTEIILSNEASANAASVPGTEINHQYSKTSQFEIAFQTYVKSYLEPEIYYFSLLRPFAEIAIARSFTQYSQYFPYFRSCNVGSKQNIWCGNCSKCLFVYAILAPFLSEEELQTIFGSDLWTSESLMADWLKLLGATEVKPFECVGTIEEVQYAAYLRVNRALAKARSVSDLPLLLEQVVIEAQAGHLSQLQWDGERLVSLSPEDPLTTWHKDERVPENYKPLVRDIVGGSYVE